MMSELFLSALALPDDARVDRRVPKKLLLEQGAPSASDTRAIQEGIEELVWVSALKPVGIGVAEYRSAEREYVEIAVLSVGFHAEAKTARLCELIHRAVPYPVVLIVSQGGAEILALAHKRLSQAEAGQVVLETAVSTGPLRAESLSTIERDFLAALALSRQTARELFGLYHGWIEAVEGLAAARVTNAWAPAPTRETAERRHAALDERARLERDLIALRAQAERETQLNRRVELNLDIQRLSRELSERTKEL